MKNTNWNSHPSFYELFQEMRNVDKDKTNDQTRGKKSLQNYDFYTEIKIQS